MRATPQAITGAMQLYFSGESFRNVHNFLRLQGVNISQVSVYKWIKKYVGLMEKYLEQIKPNVSDTWRADELYLKVKGNMKYLFALMDDETRYWIAQEVADSKYNHDARSLFRKGKELMGKKPKVMITDGLPAYQDANKKEYWTKRKDTPILTGYQIFHNYIREHEGLNGRTPAEVCGIKVEGKNKWLTLIQQSSLYK